EQSPRLVKVCVVGPASERCKALAAIASAASAIADPVGAGAVPRHTDEQRPVVAEIRRPPILRVGHQLCEIFFQGRIVKLLEFFGVVEILAHGIGFGGTLVEDVEIQLLGPPVSVRPTPAGCLWVWYTRYR